MTPSEYAIIYDMDGLLIDSEPFWRKAEQTIFRKVNIELTDELCRETMGFRLDEVVEYHFIRQPWNNLSKSAIFNLILEEMEVYLREEAQWMEGALESIAMFQKAGFKTALASSSYMRLIQAVIGRKDFPFSFDAVCSAEDDQFGKPHPSVFIRTAAELGVQRQKCLVLEDSFKGVIAALAGDMKVIAIPDEESKNDPRFNAANHVLNSANELTIELVEQILL